MSLWCTDSVEAVARRFAALLAAAAAFMAPSTFLLRLLCCWRYCEVMEGALAVAVVVFRVAKQGTRREGKDTVWWCLAEQSFQERWEFKPGFYSVRTRCTSTYYT